MTGTKFYSKQIRRESYYFGSFKKVEYKYLLEHQGFKVLPVTKVVI